jgi:hypothetical protein
MAAGTGVLAEGAAAGGCAEAGTGMGEVGASARPLSAVGGFCWAQTGITTAAEAASAAPAIVLVNAVGLRRKPRLLALLGLDFPSTAAT